MHLPRPLPGRSLRILLFVRIGLFLGVGAGILSQSLAWTDEAVLRAWPGILDLFCLFPRLLVLPSPFPLQPARRMPPPHRRPDALQIRTTPAADRPAAGPPAAVGRVSNRDSRVGVRDAPAASPRSEA